MKTELAIRAEMTVNDVAGQFPSTVPVLARYGIDLCCGGSKTLAFVAQAHQLDLGALLRDLEQAR